MRKKGLRTTLYLHSEDLQRMRYLARWTRRNSSSLIRILIKDEFDKMVRENDFKTVIDEEDED
jgi:hypothetical protein